MLLAIVFIQLSPYCDGSCSQCFPALALGACPKGLLHAYRSSTTPDTDIIALEQLLVGESSKLSPVNSGTVSCFVLFCFLFPSVSFCFNISVVGLWLAQVYQWFINKTAI